MTRATIFEEHSSVVPHWFAAGVSAATVIYLDAHLDLQFVDASRIARLRHCATADEIAQLESPHPLSPDRSACYGIEDFLYPAARLGLIQRVIWVAPPHVMRVGMASALRGLQQMEGVTVEDLESFHRTPGDWIEGRLLGLDLEICDLSQLSRVSLDGCVLVDIDTDYFISVPDDTVWAQPREVIVALKELVGKGADVTIARSVGSGFLPLRHRFLADHVAALWEGRRDDADHWQSLLDLELQLLSGRRDDALTGLNEARQRRPDCAASCHALALATLDAQERARHLVMAGVLDPAFSDDVVRRLGEFRARRKRVDLATVMGLHREVAALQDSAERQATAWIALGLLYTAFGRLDEARACDEQSLRYSAGHPELALEIAKLQIARGEYAAAVCLLDRAVVDDETRVAAWLHLAECAFALGSCAQARRHGLAAHQAAPAWPEVLMRLGAFAHAVGDRGEARSMLAQHDEIQRRISGLVGRLNSSNKSIAMH